MIISSLEATDILTFAPGTDLSWELAGCPLTLPLFAARAVGAQKNRIKMKASKVSSDGRCGELFKGSIFPVRNAQAQSMV